MPDKNTTLKLYIKFARYIFSILCVLTVSATLAQIPVNTDSMAVDTIENLLKNDTIPPDSIPSTEKDTSKTETSSAITQQMDYSADSIIVDMGEEKIYLYHNGVVDYGNINLTAAFIRFDLENNLVYATGLPDTLGNIQGKPVFVEGDQEFTVDTLTYNFTTKRGIIKGVISEQEGGYLHGSIAKKHTDGTIDIKGGKYTTCDLEDPHFYIAMTKAKALDNKIVSGPLYLVLADIPTPIALPFGFFPKQKKQQSGLIIPAYGEEDARGFYLKNGGYYWMINDYMDLTLAGEIYSKGSWGLRAVSSYKKRYKFSGSVDFTYNQNVFGDKGTDTYRESSTFWVNWQHGQDRKARPGQTFSANVNLGSNEHHQLNTTDTRDYLSNQFSSSVSYRRRFGDDFNLSANLRHSQNTSTNTVNLSLPEVSFNMSSIYPFQRDNISGEPKWYEKISLSYSSSLKNRVNTKDSLLFTPAAPFENGFQHSIPISASFKFLKFFNFSPSIRYNGVLYTSYVHKQWEEDVMFPTGIDSVYKRVETDTIQAIRYAHSFGPSMSLTFNPRIYGMYQARRPETAKIPAMRHVVQPSVSFNYVPDIGFDASRYRDSVQINEEGEIEDYYRYENGIFSLPSRRDESGSVSLSLNNVFEMKVREKNDTSEELKKVKLLDRLNFSTSYNVFKDSMRWSDIRMNTSTRLLNIFNITLNGNMSIYDVDSTGREINTYLFNSNNQFARLERLSGSLSFPLSASTFNKNKSKDEVEHVGYQYYTEYEYMDFDVPWDLNLDYTISYNNRFDTEKQEFKGNVTQSIDFRGNFKLTPNWRISFKSGYDFVAKELTYTNLSVYRDLHCWEMRLSVIPFGRRKSYNFQINIKSSIFKDVKYNKRKTWQDNFYNP